MSNLPGTITITLVPRNPAAVALDVTSAILEDTLKVVVDRSINPAGWAVTVEREPFPVDLTDEQILRQHIVENQPLADGGSASAAREVELARKGLTDMGLTP